MTTPISFFVCVDVSKGVRDSGARVLRIVETVLDTLFINDDIGCAIVSDMSVTVLPFKTLRTYVQKHDILHEISLANVGDHGGDPARASRYICEAVQKRNHTDTWRPVYALLITDGRPDKARRDSIMAELADNCGVAMSDIAMDVAANAGGCFILDVLTANKHHSVRGFSEAFSVPPWPLGTEVAWVQNDIAIMKAVWHARDRIRRCRDSVDLRKLPESVAKRKAPRHIRIPSIFRGSSK